MRLDATLTRRATDPGAWLFPLSRSLWPRTSEDLFRALGSAGLQAGGDYAVALLSIDLDRNHESMFARRRIQDVSAYGLPASEDAWHYLTGSATEIQPVADAVGFRDRLDQQTKQFVHPAGLVFVTSAGTISSYLLGVGYTPADIRSAVQRASVGRIAAVLSPVLLLCFHF